NCAWQISLFDSLVPWITCSSSFLLSLLLTQASKLNRSCCQNGGTCFLGSFCICPKHFTGRHCELKEKEETQFSITALLHGEWTREGCLLCQCVYGILHCFPQDQEDGCGKKYHYSFLKHNSLMTCQWPNYTFMVIWMNVGLY
uniref:EGF-like domain-containing protein n=1 Tax=Chelydra serpentina TaxID=8475 RepID=A0A8C3S030_CHESE